MLNSLQEVSKVSRCSSTGRWKMPLLLRRWQMLLAIAVDSLKVPLPTLQSFGLRVLHSSTLWFVQQFCSSILTSQQLQLQFWTNEMSTNHDFLHFLSLINFSIFSLADHNLRIPESVSAGCSSNSSHNKCLFISDRSLFLKCQLIRALSHKSRWHTPIPVWPQERTSFKTYLFCQRELEDILIKLKDKSPQEHWKLVLGKEGIQASPRGISSFQLRCHSWGQGSLRKRRGGAKS